MTIGALIDGRFRLERLIGRGGMGEVFQAVDTTTGEPVAVKLLLQELVAPDRIERFLREGEALRLLNHPGIVRVLATPNDGKRWAIVMEYMPQGSVADLLEREGRLPLRRMLELALDLTDALTRVHRLNILHRDLKPANVLLAADGTPRLSDFGLAHVASSPRLTERGALLGTIPYLSPEACRGEPLDTRSDVWAMGILFYELLTGRPPFDASYGGAILTAILTDRVPDLASRRPDVPPDLAALIERMLAKDREVRIPSVRLVGAELERLLQGDAPEMQPPRVRATPTLILPGGPTTDLFPNSAPQKTPSNLPAQPTALVGRVKEVAQVCDLMRRESVRLLTLTGPGGTGKTRLALQSAQSMLEDFAHGAWFVSLASLRDPDLVASTVAQALGVLEAPDQTLLNALKNHLRERTLLLLIDNFEQVITAGPVLSELLAIAPHLKILVTSREPLRLSGEQELAVPPLTLPDPQLLPPLEQLTGFDSVKLFIERAQAVLPGFTVTNQNAPAVAEICSRLDGLPLAIELAAARCKVFTPEALLPRLNHRLQILTGGSRDLPTRHQTLRNTIAWSYELLSPGEQALFARLSVFVGGATIDAATAVCSTTGDDEPFECMMALVDKSLLTSMADPQGETRFGMLETLREFALERLAGRGESDRLQEAHGRYYLELAEKADSRLREGPDQVTWVNQLEQEHDNLRVALAWARTLDDDGELEMRLGVALWIFWVLHQHRAEGRTYLKRALARAGDRDRSIRLRASVLNGLGALSSELGDYPSARAVLEESVVRWRSFQASDGLAEALCLLAMVMLFQGDHVSAMETSREAEKLSRESGITICLVYSLLFQGEIASAREDHEAALEAMEEALRIARARSNELCIARALFSLGSMAATKGDYDEARQLFEESALHWQALGYTGGLYFIGHLLRLQGQYARARGVFLQCVTRARERNDPSAILWAMISLGHLTLLEGDLDRAATQCEEAVALGRRVGDGTALSIALRMRGMVSAYRGEIDHAEELCSESLKLARRTADAEVLAWSLLSSGRVMRRRGDIVQASALYREALVVAAGLWPNEVSLACLEALACLEGVTGHAERAAKLLASVEGARERRRMVLAPIEREKFQEDVAAIRVRLGDVAFEAAWTGGCGLPIEHAIAIALERSESSPHA